MTDAADNQTLQGGYTNIAFQDRCRLRFINAAIAVGTEVLSLTTNGVTASTSNVLNFVATTGVVSGMSATDLFGAVIPNGTLVRSATATAVTLTNNVTGSGVLSGDIINFSPQSHAQRLALSGALFAGTVDLQMLAMVVLSNATNRANFIADPTAGSVTDANIDFQINSVFTGIATSRNW